MGDSPLKRLFLILVVLISIIGAGTALAADTTDAIYTGTIRNTNNSTAATNVSVPFSANTTVYIDGGYMLSTAVDTAILNASGSDVAYMPGYENDVWVIFVPSIGATTIANDTLYMGGTTDMVAALRYFPAAGGMNVPDIEPGDNSTLNISGFFDNTVADNLTQKDYDYRIYGDGSGNLTWHINGDNYTDPVWLGTYARLITTEVSYPQAQMVKRVRIRAYNAGGGAADSFGLLLQVYNDDTSSYQNPDTATGTWTDIANVIDGDTGTGSTENIPATSWGSYGVFTFTTPINSSKLQFRWNDNPNTVDVLSIELNDVTDIGVSGLAAAETVFQAQIDIPFRSLGIDTSGDITPPTDGLVLNAPLWQPESNNSSFTTLDSNAHTATVTTATWTDVGYDFDGTTPDYIDFPQQTDLFYGGNWTVNLWCNVTNNGTYQYFWANHFNSSANYSGVWFSTTRMVGHIFDGAAYQTVQTPVLSDGWVMVTLVSDTGDMTIYNDGADNSEDVVTSLYPGGVNAFRIGARLSGVPPTYPITGQIGEVQIYNRVLSSTEVDNLYDATKTKYGVSGDVYTYSNYSGVLGNSSNISFFENGVMPYVETANITLGGTLTGSWEWEYAETFTDGSGNGNTATPTFRTTSSDADVSAELVSFGPITQAQAPSFSVNVTTEGWITAADTQSSNFTTTTNATYPGSDIMEAVTTAGNVPIQVPELIISGVILLALSLFVSWALKRSRERSLLVKALILGGGIGVMIAVSLFDYWMVLMFAFIVIAIILGANQRSFTGTGIASNNYVGAGVMAFVGMTTINRILEGQLLQGSDITIIRNMTAFQPFEVFGIFTIPVPNTSFFLNGIPALFRWDYSFFGGNAQIFQYMFYSVTAAMSFILLVIVFGAVYQMFSRARV